jgi:hypothetical protein
MTCDAILRRKGKNEDAGAKASYNFEKKVRAHTCLVAPIYIERLINRFKFAGQDSAALGPI